MRSGGVFVALLGITLVAGCPMPTGDSSAPLGEGSTANGEAGRSAADSAEGPGAQTGACCLLVICEQITLAECIQQQGYFLGEGRACADVVCLGALLALADPCHGGLMDFGAFGIDEDSESPAFCPDIDDDGVPNENDPDIDGDGLPNEYDPDVDGDGAWNGFDVDVDGDGVLNIHDVDIDGDFVRNRWDLDIDGDGLLNPNDDDADGDGKKKKDDCDDDDDDDDGSGSGDNAASGDDDDDECKEDEENEDKGPQNTPDGRNAPEGTKWLPAQPTGIETKRMFKDIEDVLDETPDVPPDAVEDLQDADPDASPADLADTLVHIVEEAIDDGPPGEIDTDAAQEKFHAQVDTIQRLSAIEDGAKLDELVRETDVLVSAADDLGEEVEPLVDTAVAVGATDDTPDVTEATKMAVELVTEANAAGIPAEQVPPVVKPLASAAKELPGEPGLDVVWKIVTDLMGEARAEGGEPPYSALSTVKTVERTAKLIDNPTEEQLKDSARNVLAAAAEKGLRNPIAVVDAVERSGGDASDGIDEDEADSAADLVVEDEAADNGA